VIDSIYANNKINAAIVMKKILHVKAYKYNKKYIILNKGVFILSKKFHLKQVFIEILLKLVKNILDIIIVEIIPHIYKYIFAVGSTLFIK